MDFEGVFYNTLDYEIIDEPLGKGTFAEVYLTRNINEPDKLFAIKIFNTDKGFDGDKQMKFLRESLILHNLNHPSIVKLKGINFKSIFNQSDSLLRPSIITEYVPNGSLRSVLKNERMRRSNPEWTVTKKYISLLGISSAMRYLHEHGIIHRDLKSDNILLDENFYPKVCDFGISRCFPYILTKTIQITMTSEMGTPIYMAPELIDCDDEHFGPMIDVYSFGILAYEIVTGKRPYCELTNITPFRLYNRVRSGYRPQFTDGVTQKMMDLIKKCWSQNIMDRPTFAEIFTDFSYFNEKIDENEVNDFLANLEIERKKEEEEKKKDPKQVLIEKLKEENNKRDDIIIKLMTTLSKLKKYLNDLKMIK